MVDFKIIASRDITVGDIKAAARAMGRPLLPYGGRINLSNPGGPHRDVTFYPFKQFSPANPAYQADTVVYKIGSDARPHKRSILLKFRIRTPNPSSNFTAAEVNTMVDTMCAAFGASSSVGFNRRASRTLR